MQRRSPLHRSVPFRLRRGARGPCACQVGVAISRLRQTLLKRLPACTATSASQPQFRAPIFHNIGQAQRCSVTACAVSLRMLGCTRLSPTRWCRLHRLSSGVNPPQSLPDHWLHRKVPRAVRQSCCRIRFPRITIGFVSPSCRACSIVWMPIFATAQPRVRSLKSVVGTAARRARHQSGLVLPSRYGEIASRVRRAWVRQRGTSTN